MRIFNRRKTSSVCAVTVRCPECGALFSVSSEDSGKLAQCIECSCFFTACGEDSSRLPSLDKYRLAPPPVRVRRRVHPFVRLSRFFQSRLTVIICLFFVAVLLAGAYAVLYRFWIQGVSPAALSSTAESAPVPVSPGGSDFSAVSVPVREYVPAAPDTQTPEPDIQPQSGLRLRECLELARQGNANAMYRAGEMYESGQDCEADYSEAYRWYLAAAERGFSQAFYKLGCFCYHGLGVRQSSGQAFIWWNKEPQSVKSREALSLYLSNAPEI